MKIKFDLEGKDEPAAFFAIYAGIRMYKEQRENRVSEGNVSITAAEAYGLLEDLKEQHPHYFESAKKEYDEAYKNLLIIV